MDPTLVAIPGYFASMAAENRWLKRRSEREGRPSPADYERHDTVTSLAMGVGSLLAPMVLPKILGPITPGVGRFGKVLVGTAAAAVVATTIADRLAELEPGEGASRQRRRRIAERARQVARVGGVTSIVAGGIGIASAWTHHTKATRLWKRRILPDLGDGMLGFAAAMVGWDLIYYWNHRFMHEARYMWAIHVVHHSSERYNLSTALRQPVADAFGTFVPYGLLSLFGIRPSLILQARGLNLVYQYWIHTDAIRTIGPFEAVLNSPSHHRVHHGRNQQYLDRNHGGILISWDRVFGTFEPELEPVVYGLTKNIETFNLVRVATHEHRDILRDVAGSDNWSDRLSFVLRGPGWAYARHAQQAIGAAQPV